MYIIPGSPFLIQERMTTANGVEKTISVEPAGGNREHAHKLFHERVAANRPAYAPHTGIRIVLVESTGGGR